MSYAPHPSQLHLAVCNHCLELKMCLRVVTTEPPPSVWSEEFCTAPIVCHEIASCPSCYDKARVDMIEAYDYDGFPRLVDPRGLTVIEDVLEAEFVGEVGA